MDGGATFTTIWEQAKAQYKLATGEDLDNPAVPHPATTDDLLASLDKENKNFKAFREKRSKIFSVLAAVCRPIELISTIGSSLSAVFPPAASLGALRILLTAADGVSASYDAILDLLSTLKDFLVRLKIYTQETLEPHLQGKLAEILAILLQVFGRSTKLIKTGTLGRVLQFTKNVLLGRDEKLQGLVDQLEKLCRGEQRLVAAETLTEVKRTGHTVEGIDMTLGETKTIVQDTNTRMNQVSSDMENLTVGQQKFHAEFRLEMENMNTFLGSRNRGLERIKEILQPSVYPQDMYQSIAKRRVPGTGDWVRSEQLFQAWMEKSQGPVLRISGNPGSGKSFVAQNIISLMLELHPQGLSQPSPTSVGYFFFRDTNPETRKAHRALKDLAFQIYENDPGYRKYVDSCCHSADNIATISSAWRTLFLGYNSSPDRNPDTNIFLVFDGVDEAFQEDQRSLFEMLSYLMDSQQSCIHVLLIGRPEIFDDLVEALEQGVPTIHVDWRKNAGDIASYVQKCFQKSRILSNLSKPHRLEIERILMEKSQGMFLWADLMLRELTKKSRASSMLESLRKAPKGLNEMLEHVLETFSESLDEDAAYILNMMLAWVACAERPLTISDFEEILNLESLGEDGVLGEQSDDMIIDLETTLRTQYASLFLLHREDGLTTADLEAGDGTLGSDKQPGFHSNARTTLVVFCHASIGDYLRNPEHPKVRSREDSVEIGVDIIRARVNALKICMRAICGIEYRYELSWIRDYALFAWSNHLRQVVDCLHSVNPKEMAEIGRLLCKILMEPNVEMFENGTRPDMAIEFICNKTMELIVTIFAAWTYANHIDDDETQVWVQSCVATPAQTFALLGRQAARRWLVEPWLPGRSMDCMRAVWTVLVLLEGGSIQDMPKSPSEETVLKAARWAQLEEDARWHHRVGACLNTLDYHAAASKHMETAFELQPDLWVAREYLALCYRELGKTDLAIQLQKECEMRYAQLLAETKVLGETADLESITSDLARVRDELAMTYIEQGDRVNALYWIRKCVDVKSYVETCSAVEVALRLLISSPDTAYSEIMQLIKSMDVMVEDWNLESHTYLNQCLLNQWIPRRCFLACAVAAQATGELLWLESKLKDEISREKTRQSEVSAMCLEELLAHLYDRFLGEEDKAIRIWRRITALPRVTLSRHNVLTECKNLVASAYASRLFSNALSKTTEEQEENLHELEKLCKDMADSPSDSDDILGNPAAMYMGVWHQVHGRDEHARIYFKPYVKQALLLLDDDDTANAMRAYYVLGHILVKAGEDLNAIAALQLAHNDFTLRDGRSASPAERMASPWPLLDDGGVWYCNGCIRTWGNYTDCNVCRYCDADLCDRCLDALRSGQAIRHACHPSHAWLHIPAPTAIPDKGQIIRDGQVLSIDEFKTMLETAWI
ncbi:hypothetical protein CDV55_101215 [Aspergillus turcosus]|nr:hypothetical protein CDV55_101215 [Aspergillus turcosus]